MRLNTIEVFFIPTGFTWEKARMSPGLQLVENTAEEAEEKEQNKTRKNRVCQCYYYYQQYSQVKPLEHEKLWLSLSAEVDGDH